MSWELHRITETINNVICTKCETSYYHLVNGRYALNNLFLYSFFCLNCEGETMRCDKYKEWYYLNENDICYSWGENIKRCHEENKKIIIDECLPNSTIIDLKCLSKWETGIKEKCLYYKTEYNKINQCGDWNKGYYIPSDYIKQDICFSCDIEGCVNFSGTITEKKYLECHKDYLLFEGKRIKNCEIGEEYRCLTCNIEEGKNDRCGSCNNGYYLQDFSTDINNNFICQECPAGCSSCYLDGNSVNCTEFKTNYLLKNGKCIEDCTFMKNCLDCDDSGDYPQYMKWLKVFIFLKI